MRPARGKPVVLAFDGLKVAYAPHEAAFVRSLLDAPGDPAAVLAPVRLIHRLKALLDAVMVDEDEEASIRRGWASADTAAMRADMRETAA